METDSETYKASDDCYRDAIRWVDEELGLDEDIREDSAEHWLAETSITAPSAELRYAARTELVSWFARSDYFADAFIEWRTRLIDDALNGVS